MGAKIQIKVSYLCFLSKNVVASFFCKFLDFYLHSEDMRKSNISRNGKKSFKKWSYLIVVGGRQWLNSRKMRKILNMLSLYLYEFPSWWGHIRQLFLIFWTRCHEISNQLVISNILFFKFPFQFDSFFCNSSFKIQCLRLDGLHLVLSFPSAKEIGDHLVSR